MSKRTTRILPLKPPHGSKTNKKTHQAFLLGEFVALNVVFDTTARNG